MLIFFIRALQIMPESRSQHPPPYTVQQQSLLWPLQTLFARDISHHWTVLSAARRVLPTRTVGNAYDANTVGFGPLSESYNTWDRKDIGSAVSVPPPAYAKR